MFNPPRPRCRERINLPALCDSDGWICGPDARGSHPLDSVPSCNGGTSRGPVAVPVPASQRVPISTARRVVNVVPPVLELVMTIFGCAVFVQEAVGNGLPEASTRSVHTT